jgi:uncharacterized protein (TIGR03118 family)
MPRLTLAIALVAASAASTALADDQSKPNRYVVTALTSDLPNVAANQDPVLQNAWGITFAPSATPFWISDNATGCSTLYDGAGVPQPSPPLKVKIPLPGGTVPNTACVTVNPKNPPNPTPAAPTGVVWNPTTTFLVPGTQIPAVFIWVTEDGTVSAWAPTLQDTSHAVLAADNSTSGLGAVYKAAVFGTNKQGVFLYVTDFRNGNITVFAPNGSTGFQPASSTQIPGNFTDPDIPAGFAPFGIKVINGNLFVTYALQNAAKHDDVAGPGNGFVDIFDTDGNFIRRFASQGTLNSPWGLEKASYTFGRFSGDLLVGNFGDGKITAFDEDGKPRELLRDTNNKPLSIDGLWSLTLGGGKNSNTDVLYFTAGPNGETDGLFGTITPKP